MPRTDRFRERIGAVFLPEADAARVVEEPAAMPDLAGLEGLPPAGLTAGVAVEGATATELLPSRTCSITLKQGCYTLSFVPLGTPLFGTRFRGTLRVEQAGPSLRFSGDLYRHRLFGQVMADSGVLRERQRLGANKLPADEAANTGGTIPISRRADYHSYLRGTAAQLTSVVPKGAPCRLALEVEEFVYQQPATGFSGSFDPTPTRSIRFVLAQTPPDLFIGLAFEGTTLLGVVSIRWISSSYRRASLRVFTLQGAETPPAAVDGASFATIFADAGWEFAVADGGTIQLPPALSGVDISDCWSDADLHTLLASVPGYDPSALDTDWRLGLLAVPARLGCSRGVMFDSSFGADPNAVPREGSATFSHDGYPAGDVPDGAGGSHYDTAADQQQRNVPRAFLRSATHEVGHAFNQIHQGFELGNDNSIMTPTPGVADVLGTAGVFPDQINLAFNDQVKRHLRHLPDPAVRPGAMDFFGSAIAAPEAADVDWLDDTLELTVTPSADRIALGEPITLEWTLTNRGTAPVLVPNEVDVDSLVARVSVSDPSGRITFMRPPAVRSCPKLWIEPLEPGESVRGSATVFWGPDGFAFEAPGRHRIEVIVLWEVAGVPVAVSGERYVFVTYPTSSEDNEVAAQLLHPDVGKAVVAGDPARFGRAAERIGRALELQGTHPANETLRQMGLVPQRRGRRKRG
jgi:hypothetical protein